MDRRWARVVERVARWLDLRLAQVATLATEGDQPPSNGAHSQHVSICGDREHLWASLSANLPEVGCCSPRRPRRASIREATSGLGHLDSDQQG